MIYKERYKVELEDIGRENKIDNKRIVTIMEDIAGSHWGYRHLLLIKRRGYCWIGR
jgi:hypothetical protein